MFAWGLWVMISQKGIGVLGQLSLHFRITFRGFWLLALLALLGWTFSPLWCNMTPPCCLQNLGFCIFHCYNVSMYSCTLGPFACLLWCHILQRFLAEAQLSWKKLDGFMCIFRFPGWSILSLVALVGILTIVMRPFLLPCMTSFYPAGDLGDA